MTNQTLRITMARGALVSLLSAAATFSFGSSASLAAADHVAGQQFFVEHCTPCHATEPGVNKIGPSLAGVVGRKSGSAPGYSYSDALKAANITWDDKTLDPWLQNPMADVLGAKMFATVPNVDDRQNVIAYLETLK